MKEEEELKDRKERFFLRPPYPSPMSCLDHHEMCWEGERHQLGGAPLPDMANIWYPLSKICKNFFIYFVYLLPQKCVWNDKRSDLQLRRVMPKSFCQIWTI